jgi:two-component system cell cycle sensor histidine kinase/response regulator CckA
MLRRVAGREVNLVVVPGENIGVVLADAVRLEQVIVNLVANSRDAMPEGGQIVIETANVRVGPDDQQHHPKLKPGRFVRLEVRDTGIGMNSDTRDHMFEPFFTTKKAGEGTGLGLSTSYGAVVQLGGAIEVESEVGKGAAIAILLPWAGDQPSDSVAGEPV